MTELSFLLDLLVNHKLTKVTKDAILLRIGQVEMAMHPKMLVPLGSGVVPPHLVGQAPSTVAAMMKHEVPAPAPVPIEAVAQTPAAAAALAARQEAMNQAMNGKGMSPRKFRGELK